MNEVPLNCQLLSLKVPEGADLSKPLPIRISITRDEPNAWATSDGRRVFSDEAWAAKSMEMDTAAYRDRQQARMAAGRLLKATVVAEPGDWITATGDEDDYHESVEALLEHYSDNRRFAPEHAEATEGSEPDEAASLGPAWAFCCTESSFDFDLEGAIESYLDDEHHEDAADHLVGMRELAAFFDAWKKKQSLRSYHMDTSRIVVIDRERYEKELEAARKLLEDAA